MEALIALAGGLIAAGLMAGFKQIGATLFMAKYGFVIGKTFDVIDSIAGEIITGYDGSEVQKAVELAVARVSDGTLDEEDIVEVTNYVIAKFNPTLAAVKVLDPESEEAKASQEILAGVKSMRDGVSFDEVKRVALAAKALI